MSFSSDIKNELAGLTNSRLCCIAAQAYGMAEFGHAFTENAVSLLTENRAVAERYTALIRETCGITLMVNAPEKGGTMTVSAVSSDDCRTILERFGHGRREVAIRINRANLDCESCTAAFLRGVFLACGTMTNPQVDYHLEFSVPYYNLSRDLMILLREMGLPPKTVRRKGNYVVYFKESEQIEDCLTLMGAVDATLELMNVKVYKSIRNDANRVANCERANIDKTVAAAVTQMQAVRKIEESLGLDALPEDWRDLCRLRLDNPDFSLRELGENLNPPISRSGVNHRFQRILEFADKL